MTTPFETDIENALAALKEGGIILYPTDTIWGLGCDATNEAAIQKIYTLKNRSATKSLIVFLADAYDLLHYVAAPDPAVYDFIEALNQPTTIVFENAIGLPQNLIAPDGSIGIRIVTDAFCRHLIKRLRKPLVSTSANTSGDPAPLTFDSITETIKKKADYIVRWRQQDQTAAQPSRVVKWHTDGTTTVLRS